ncbi:hypothetical protein QJS10_CPB17g00203 [Acorus calamus]|uniref:Endonuclease/exonuclease/phosphatase domain-containing protein n=1 Tax=Acorus calamus TaxID=4465 RepID=A0AAV9CRN6_ACOCL|nr:hypothetical protein QJS10_CPB17g00203 [Acorus calamus]
MSVSITVMTLNLHEDPNLIDGPNSWEKRRDLCISVITNYSPTILCTQQGVKPQLEFLQQCLPGYGQFGISRKGPQDDTDERCTIFYDKDKPSCSQAKCLTHMATHSIFTSKFARDILWRIQYSERINNRTIFARKIKNEGGITGSSSNIEIYRSDLIEMNIEHGVVGDMRDAWPNARVRKNVSLIRTYHGFKGDKQGTKEFLKLIFRALCLCWDRQTQDLHIDWILFRGRSLIPVSCEVVNDNIDSFYPSSHYPICAEFMLPRTVRLLEEPV